MFMAFFASLGLSRRGSNDRRAEYFTGLGARASFRGCQLSSGHDEDTGGPLIEGEDIVQDTLAKVFFALGTRHEPPPLRPWRFRIAHNPALDFLKSHGHALTELYADLTEVAGYDDRPDPFATRLALARFLTLPYIAIDAEFVEV
jgi:hypothetical protein